MKVTVYLPERAEEGIGKDLVELTRILCEEKGCEEWGGLLGGKYGYGTDYENDTFEIHHFCWCEREDCPWCGGCTCPESRTHYFVDGKEVTRGDFGRFFEDYVGETKDITERRRKAQEANSRRKIVHDPVCDYCLGKGVFSTHGAEPGRGAPNFWHKPSGFKVWWYKWIGRDMEYNREITEGEWKAIFEDCVRSLSNGS